MSFKEGSYSSVDEARERIRPAYDKLSPEQSVLQDKLLEFSMVKESDMEHFKSVYTLGPKQVDSIIKSLDRDKKIWQGIDYAKAKELDLELNFIPGNEFAERLLLEVIDKKIDITTDEGRKIFVDQWNKECPYLPMPCVPPNDFWYLEQLSQTPTRIIANRGKRKINQPAIPNFAEDEILFVDNWQEQDFGTAEATESHHSKLLEALLGDSSTVNISRETLDNALWSKNPANRQPTKKHQEILKQLKCDPKEFELRPIRQDEYARLATSYGWGQKNLWTNFDNYSLEGGGRFGLDGGYRYNGGASGVDYSRRGNASGDLSVRLVLSRKH